MNLNRPVWLDKQVLCLAIAETIVWAGLFYLFPASLLQWNNHFGWELSEISLALTISLIISSLSGIASGKLVDAGAGKHLLSFSALLGGLVLVFLIAVESIWAFYAVWAIVGIAMGGCSYDPCFAVITRKYGNSAKAPIVMVTFFAGLAVTFCFLISSLVFSLSDWQANIIVFSCLLCLIAAPLFWFGGSNYMKSSKPSHLKSLTNSENYLKSILSKPIFWGLLILFSVFGLNHIMIMSQILPLLESITVEGTLAVLVSASMGIMQVSGRMSLVGFEKLAHRQLSTTKITLACGIALSVASVVLGYSGGNGLMILIFLVLQGFSFGIINIIKPVITAEKLGQSNFGVISSVVGVGYIWGFAFAPAISGYVFDAWGHGTLILSTFIIALAGSLIFAVSILWESKKAKILSN